MAKRSIGKFDSRLTELVLVDELSEDDEDEDGDDY